jgi:hypothetical protein
MFTSANLKCGLLILGASLAPAFALAESGPEEWDQHWKDCHNLQMPIFQAKIGDVQNLLHQGKEWETQVKQELVEIRDVTEVTCKKWAENPNGDVPLQDFIRRFSAIASSAVSLKHEASEEITPRIERWIKTEFADLARLGFRFDEFACGQSFLKSKRRILENLQLIEERFAELKAKCPKAADSVIAKALAAGPNTAKFGAANGGPGRVPAGASVNGRSDITGTRPAAKKGGSK